jgi:hypothetical protein
MIINPKAALLRTDMSYEFEGEREYETEPARDIGPLRNSRRAAIVISNCAGIDRERRDISLEPVPRYP